MSNVPNDDRLVVGASAEAAPPQHHAVDGVLLPLEDLPTLSSELLPHSHISITTDCEHCVGEMGVKHNTAILKQNGYPYYILWLYFSHLKPLNLFGSRAIPASVGRLGQSTIQ